MATQTQTSMEKVLDPELADWLSRESGEAREILVDAVLPRRNVTFEKAGSRPRATRIEEAAKGGGRKEALGQLRRLLETLLDNPPVVLEAAGALAIRATSRQVRNFVDHPLVKSVRLNRRRHAPA
jgi:hypothetical protein